MAFIRNRGISRSHYEGHIRKCNLRKGALRELIFKFPSISIDYIIVYYYLNSEKDRQIVYDIVLYLQWNANAGMQMTQKKQWLR